MTERAGRPQRGASLGSATPPRPGCTAPQLEAVARVLVERAGLEPSLLMGPGFESLVNERVLRAAGGAADRYIELLRTSGDESERLILGVAVPETWLFRYPRSFALLAERLRAFRERSARPDDVRLSLVSVGCANGAEPWSIAATCLHVGFDARSIDVLAIDRSADMLAVAERGELPASALRADAPAWATQYLHRRGDVVTVDPSLRPLVRFERADARAAVGMLPARSCAAIFFRNVLIYLGAEARRPLLVAIAAALADDGLLLLGHADPVAELPAQLRSVKAPHAFAYERCPRTGAAGLDPLPKSGARRAVAPPPPAAPDRWGAESPAPRRTGSTAGARDRPPATAPGSPGSLDEARRLADAGRLAEAEALAGTIVRRDGVTVDTAELLGLIASARNDVDGARRWFEQAVYLQPDRVDSLAQLGLLAERRGDATRAAALRNRARRAERRGSEESEPRGARP